MVLRIISTVIISIMLLLYILAFSIEKDETSKGLPKLIIIISHVFLIVAIWLI